MLKGPVSMRSERTRFHAYDRLEIRMDAQRARFHAVGSRRLPKKTGDAGNQDGGRLVGQPERAEGAGLTRPPRNREI